MKFTMDDVDYMKELSIDAQAEQFDEDQIMRDLAIDRSTGRPVSKEKREKYAKFLKDNEEAINEILTAGIVIKSCWELKK